MRARRGQVLGWMVVALYAGLLAAVTIVSIQDGRHPTDGSQAVDPSRDAAEPFIQAWERSRQATFVATGTYARRSPTTGASIASEDVLAQRPPRRLHRQLGGVEGRVDDRLVLCPAPPPGDDEPAPCRLGAPGPRSYAESVANEVAGLRSLLQGRDPLYRVRQTRPGCFHLELLRVDPRAPFGVAASFCFDAATGAPAGSRVRHEGGIVETVAVTAIRTDVSAADLTP